MVKSVPVAVDGLDSRGVHVGVPRDEFRRRVDVFVFLKVIRRRKKRKFKVYEISAGSFHESSFIFQF